MRRIVRGMVLSVVLAMNYAVPAATTYFVDPSGLDTGNTGLSGSPFREIRKALTKVVAGDTVLVSDGQYKGFDVDNIHGTPSNPITIKAVGTGALVTITTDRSDNRDTIFVTNTSTYVVIDGLRSFSANRSAVRIDQCAFITIRNGVFGNNATWGIFTDFSDNLLLEGNECYSSGTQHGIYVSNTCTGAVVRGNLLHDNFANGLHMNGDVSQGGAGIITNALVENNIIYSNGAGGGSGINCDGVQNSVIRNNLIYSAGAAGISLYQTDASGPAKNNLVVNNTIEVAATGKWCMQIHRSFDPGALPNTGNVLFNNVFLTLHATRGSIHIDDASNLTGLISDYNILTTNAHCVTTDDDTTNLTLAQWKALNFDTHSISSTEAAVFVNPSTHDYHLKTVSTALNIGISTLSSNNAPTTDIEGNPRPSGAGFDIGAYELQPVVLTINTASPLAAATKGSPYITTLNASGGTKPYTWTVTGGALPAGLTLSSAGVISGTPTGSGAASFTVTVTDNVAATANKTYSLTVNVVSITTASPLPAGTVGTAYSKALIAIGGTQTFTWSVTAGALPAGLTLSTGGVLSGTPTTASTANFTLQAKDGGGATATAVFALTINASGGSGGGTPTPPTVTSQPNASTSPVVVNVPVTFGAGATDVAGGTVTYAWDFGDGTTGSGATVTHIYTTPGSFTVTVTMTGSNGGVTTATLPITVVSAGGGGTPTTIPMTISKLQGAANFKLSGKDSCSFSGVLPNLPTTFTSTSKVVVLNVDGVNVSFTLDAKGRAKSVQGSMMLKLKTKRDKATKKVSFIGGNVPFSVKLTKGTFAATWNFDSNTTILKSSLVFPITLQLDGNTYAASVTASYSSKAKTAAKFKK